MRVRGVAERVRRQSCRESPLCADSNGNLRYGFLGEGAAACHEDSGVGGENSPRHVSTKADKTEIATSTQTKKELKSRGNFSTQIEWKKYFQHLPVVSQCCVEIFPFLMGLINFRFSYFSIQLATGVLFHIKRMGKQFQPSISNCCLGFCPLSSRWWGLP